MPSYPATVAMAIHQNVEPDVRAHELTEEECKAVANAIVKRHTDALVNLFKQFGDDSFAASEVASMIKAHGVGLVLG